MTDGVDDFITADGTTVTVDPGETGISMKTSHTPGYRAIYAKVCNPLVVDVETCSMHSM